MKNFKISYIGKTLFWLSFLLGNICLFGFIFTRDEAFAVAGYLLLIYAGGINAIAFLGLMLYARVAREFSREAVNAALLLLVNIPVAVLYTLIGINISIY
ncbi:hypothetical protein [Chryseobacterium sp. MFBS3-17]|uniref:hypothetical protein n=1 Tax=Chryseobacterium sp. MFBS3-17 TaxID=2886689 RepID=UPI001D0E3C1B|nr:hypothetical protein [Chryseobacterium sp. MFBS3-17]MCC2589608.1 hypothetical protein [Chryseobacterium sp. MFBS3-17]